MLASYASIFDGSTIITRKDLCEMLNLDIERPRLEFTPVEIQRAFKKRALMFHPDRRELFNPKLSKELAEKLFNDMTRAKEHLLKNETNIMGKAFQDNLYTSPSKDWIEIAISTLYILQTGTLVSGKIIPWLKAFSGDYLMILVSSYYSDGQLNFRYINTYAAALDAVRPYMQYIDGKTVAAFLVGLKNILASTEEVDIDQLAQELKKILPENISKHAKYDELVAAIKSASKQLKDTLTDDFISDVEYIIKFWSNFIANVPSWKHILGVYFVSSIFTASSVPKFFNALTVISEVIIQHKGASAFELADLPLLLGSVLLLPINSIVQLSIQLNGIAWGAAFKILTNGFQLVTSLLALAFTDQFAYHAFNIFESAFNLSIRLALNIVMETLNALIYYVTDISALSSILETMNTAFDEFFAFYRPDYIKPQTEDVTTAITVVPNNNTQNETPTTAANIGIFSNTNANIHNAEDKWLNDLKNQLMANQQDEEMAAPAHAMG